MKAAVYHTYGAPEVVSVVEMPKPQPKKHEVLVKIKSVAITAADARIRAAHFPKGFAFFARLAFGLFSPRKSILGACFSGVVEAVGDEVTLFKVGDEVCGMNSAGFGMHAEYGVMKANGPLVKKPEGVSHDDAAAMLFGGAASLYFLRDRAKIQKGQKVLVNGAAGALGTNAVQLARYFSATVIGAARAENSDFVMSLGAQQVIDYTKEPLEAAGPCDIVFDTAGNLTPADASRLLTAKGSLILAVAALGQMFSRDKRILTGVAPEKPEDMRFLLSLVECGELRAVIDSVYPLERIVEAYKRMDSGQKRGTVIIHPN